MGLDINGTKFLLYARRHGVSFTRTAMIGRQSILINAGLLAANLRQFGCDSADATALDILKEGAGFAEPLLRFLGADEITSFDASDYEKASIVHDFNAPIPDKFKNKFSAVLDGGTLEHVFNFPTAIKNCMEMVEVGGHFLCISPANNHFGHGFYQFSPDLFYRIFSRENGFEVQKMFVFEETFINEWYEVSDPDSIGERVLLINNDPSMLLIIAKKIAVEEIFASPPQQSDYLAAWKSEAKFIPTDDHIFYDDGSRFTGLAIRGWKHLQHRFNRSFGMLKRRKSHFKKIDVNE